MNTILTLSNLLYFCSFLLVLKPIIEAKNKEPHWFKKNVFLFIIASVILVGNIIKGISDSDDKLNTQRSQYLRDSANTVKYIDSLKRYNLKVITVLAERNLWYDSIQNSIKRIDTAKVKNTQEPLISPDLVNTHHRISNDTIYLFPSIRNSGNDIAYDVTYSAHFFTQNKLLDSAYLFKKRPPETDGIDIPVNEALTLKSDDFYVPNFHKTTSNYKIFMLLMGKYKNARGVTKKLLICLRLSDDNSWSLSADGTGLEKALLNSKKYK